MDPGLRLKNHREKLGLRYREVQQASEAIAQRRRSAEFVVGLSRLADIENKGVTPSVARLYSLCAIYRLDFHEVLSWYGVPLDEIWSDAVLAEPPNSHPLSLRESSMAAVNLPLHLDPGVDLDETQYLTRLIRRWGRLPLSLLDALDIAGKRFGVVGAQDLRMYPLLRPGAIVQIDNNRREIAEGGWANEFERPIYFLETRTGYCCCWCSRAGENLILQPHHGSPCKPEILSATRDVDVIGQVVGVAMHLLLDDAPEELAFKKRRRAARVPE